MRRLTYPTKHLLLSWLGAAGMFAAVEWLTGLQVRYLVFLTPIVAIAAGVVLEALGRRGRFGWYASLAIIGCWLVQTLFVWYSGTFANIAPSMIPLASS